MRVRTLVGCFIGIAENLIGVMTLGWWVPGWQLRWVTRSIYRDARKQQQRILRGERT
jgi:hypothetical protein